MNIPNGKRIRFSRRGLFSLGIAALAVTGTAGAAHAATNPSTSPRANTSSSNTTEASDATDVSGKTDAADKADESDGATQKGGAEVEKPDAKHDLPDRAGGVKDTDSVQAGDQTGTD